MTVEFDEADLEPQHGERSEVVTLGFGKLLGMFFLLLLVCALCFAGGYFVGRRGAGTATSAAPATGTGQQPLQPGGAAPKPSAGQQDAVAVPATAPDALSQNSAPGSPTAGNASAQSTPQSTSQSRAQSTPQPANLPRPASALPPRPVAKQTLRPADSAPSAPDTDAPFVVQIAAVANANDANALMNTLRKLKYPATAEHNAADHLIHVRMGPFATRAEAEEWRTLLANDGYNAVVQQ